MTDSPKPIDDDVDLDAEPELVKDLDVDEDDAHVRGGNSAGASHAQRGVA